jgi:4-hydroxy-3-polyprenylbenzoate decarboxylase
MKGAPRRLIVGITGAPGITYGVRLLDLLRRTKIETHLILTNAAQIGLPREPGSKATEIYERADFVHPAKDIAAPISSGSFQAIGVVVAPCSVKTLAEIATGTTGTGDRIGALEH